MHALVNYAWPGNVRELANVLERAQILAEGHVITVDDLPETMQTAPFPPDVFSPGSLNLNQLERRAVQTALQQAEGNKVRAAEALGVTRRTLYRLIAKHGLDKAHGDQDGSSGLLGSSQQEWPFSR